MTGKAQTPGDGSIRADKIKAEAVKWLWPQEGNLPEEDDNYEQGRIPEGMLTVIGGRPGRGKSISTAEFAAYVSNLKDERNGVLFSNMEDPLKQVVRPRLDAAGANMKHVHFFNFFLPKDPQQLETTLAMLRAMIYSLKIRLIIVDPIAAHIGPSLYNDQQVRQVLSPLTKMLEETGTAMIAVTHINKHVSKNSDPQAAFGGSGGGLMGAARAAYAFDKDPSDESMRVLAQVKYNLGPEPQSVGFEMESEEWSIGKGEGAKVIRTGKLNLVSWAHPADAKTILVGKASDEDGPPAEKKAIAAEWLTGYLSQGVRLAKDLREDAAEQGISWATLRRAAEEVGVLKLRRDPDDLTKGKFGAGSVIVWSLPEGHPMHPDNPQTSLTDAPADALPLEGGALTDDDITKLLGSDDDGGA